MAAATGGTQKSLFDAIDSQDAELNEMADAIPAPPSKEIAGQRDVASMPGGEAPAVSPPTGKVEVVTPTSGIVPPIVGEQPQPSFIEPKADLIVGATGSGKTINVGDVADYVFLKYGKLTRLASTDPSGAGPLSGKVKAGKIDFWAVHAWPRPIEAMYKSTKGHWPLDSNDPSSPLVPPDVGTYEVYGFGAYEGLTSYGDTILDDLKRNNVTLSQDPSYKWSQGDFSTAGGNQSYYGMMQDTLKLWVVNTHLLGYEKVLWTALESKGKDQFGNVVAGPMIGGKQATGKAGQWFVNFVHMDMIAGKESLDAKTGQKLVEVNHVLFLKSHIDPLSMVPFPCKIRAPKEYSKEVPYYLDSGSLADAYKLLDSLYEKQMKTAIGEMDEVKGLRERLMERAAAARKREQVEAEKRAKAAGMLKPMVTVPGMPAPVIGAVPAGAIPVSKPPSPKPAGAPTPIAPSAPAGIPVIQNVRRKP